MVYIMLIAQGDFPGLIGYIKKTVIWTGGISITSDGKDLIITYNNICQAQYKYIQYTKIYNHEIFY